MTVLTDTIISIIIASALLLSGYALSKKIFGEKGSSYSHIVTGLNMVCWAIGVPSMVIGSYFGGIRVYFSFVGFALVAFMVYRFGKNRSLLKFKTPSLGVLATFLFIATILVRHIFLLAGGGILAWDSLTYYLPWARQFHRLDHIPLYDIQRPGLPIVKPPLVVLLYAFCYTVTCELEVSTTISIMFIVGLGALSGEIVRKATRSDAMSMLAMIMTMSMPIYDYLSQRWGTYLDLPLSFFYLSSIIFLIETFEEDNTKSRTLFWVSTSLAFLTKETMLPLAFTYFIVFAYYSKERLALILLSNLGVLGRVVLALFGAVSFDWIPIEWAVLSFSFLFSAQLLVSGKDDSKLRFADVVQTILDKSCIFMIFPILWYIRSYSIGSLYDTLSPYLKFGPFLFLVLFAIYVLSLRRDLPRIEASMIRMVHRIAISVVILATTASVYCILTSPAIVTPENLTLIPLASLFYAFLSNWFGFAYIVPKTYGFLHCLTGEKDRLWSCLTLCLLAVWANLGLSSIRYIAFIVPFLVLFTLKGFSKLGGMRNIETRDILFILIAFVTVLFSSLNYDLTSYPSDCMRVWMNDILRNGWIILIGILVSLRFSTVILYITNLFNSLKATSTLKGLTILVLSLSMALPILGPIQNLQYRYDYRTATLNMGYSLLLEDLELRGSSNGTILTPIPTCGTTYWSRFCIINMNDREQNGFLGLDQILISSNLTTLLEFYRDQGVKFVILPKINNWYYKTVVERFIDQKPWLTEYYPNIGLILESTKHLVPISQLSHKNMTGSALTVYDPYDYYQVYLVP